MMALPGFTADRSLASPPEHYHGEAGVRSANDPAAEITPAFGVDVTTGHCGCYLDDWFGLPCVCVVYW
jgi:hypothetical protein